MKKIITLFFIVFISLISLTAQEIGVSAVKIWTGNYEIQNPYGFGISIAQPIWKVGLKAEYISAYNERNYHGYVISGFMAYSNELIQEDVVSKSSYRAIELSLIIPKIIRYEQYGFSLSLGVTFDRFKGDRQGLISDKKVTLFEETKIGLFYGLSVSRERLFNLPIKAEIVFKQKGLLNNISVTDIEQPFENAVDIKELQLSISYIF
jgi:hypothetical protein